MQGGLLLSLAATLLAARTEPRGTGLDLPGVRRAPIDSGYVRDVSLERPAGTALRHYRLDLPGASPSDAPLGLVRWLRSPLEPGSAGAQRLEVETCFPGVGTRVIHAETLQLGARKLVWREVRERAGRTVLALQESGFELATSETLGRDVQRTTLAAPPETLFPLQLVELLRDGAESPGPLVLYEPLANGLTEVELFLRDLPGPLPLRLARLARPDGTSAGAYIFAGSELLHFCGQGGGPVATPVSADEYARLIAPSSSLASPAPAQPPAGHAPLTGG